MSSCRRFAAERSLALSGLVSGMANMRSSNSISAMVCSESIPSQYLTYEREGQTFSVGRAFGLLLQWRVSQIAHLHRQHRDRPAVHALNWERDGLRRRAGAEDV